MTSAIVVALAPWPGSVRAAEERQWVQGAWVAVRAAPAKDAKLVADWVANTPVRVDERKGEWCRASLDGDDPAAGSGATAGYVACAALGGQPLSLRDAQTPGKNGELPPDADAKAFWIAPSIGRFVDFGFHLNYRALSAEQEQREKRTKTPVRFAIPEFDAMKRRLSRGVVPVAEQELARVSMTSFKTFDGIADWRANSEIIEHLNSFDPKRNLPPAKPSLFKRHADVLLAGEAGPDAVAALLGRSNEVKFGGKPEWVTGHNDEGVWGLWDIRKIDVRYAQAAVLHSVSHAGLVGARNVQSAVVQAPSPADGCTEGYPGLPAGTPLAGYPLIKEQPLISFFVGKPLTARKLDVVTRKARVIAHSDPYSGPKNPQPRSVLVHALDLDQDGVADLAIFEWSSPGFISGNLDSQRYQFINVAGEWWYAGYESFGECT